MTRIYAIIHEDKQGCKLNMTLSLMPQCTMMLFVGKSLQTAMVTLAIKMRDYSLDDLLLLTDNCRIKKQPNQQPKLIKVS